MHGIWSIPSFRAARTRPCPAHCWADGIHLEARLEEQAQCILVIIGATTARASGSASTTAIQPCDGRGARLSSGSSNQFSGRGYQDGSISRRHMNEARSRC
jgi:hypothetical protein